MKKVLLLTKQYPGIGGIERSIEALYEQLSNMQDVQVSIVCPYSGENKQDDYIRYKIAYKFLYFEPLKICCSVKSFIIKNREVFNSRILVSRFLPISYALYKLNLNFIYIPPAVSADNFDAAIDNFKKVYGKTNPLHILTLVKMILTKKIYEYFEKKVMDYSGATIITFSENVKMNLLKQNGVERKIEVIPPGIDANYFYYKPDVYDDFRKKLQIHPESFVLLYVGRLNLDKNISILIDTFKKLDVNNKKLLLVGDGNMLIPDDNDILNVGKKNKDELLEYYNVANYLILPSFNEGFGHVLIESLACGTPIIGFDFHKNAISEIIDEKKNGIIAACCSSKKLGEAIYKAYEENNNFLKLREVISANTKNKYNWRHLAKRLTIER